MRILPLIISALFFIIFIVDVAQGAQGIPQVIWLCTSGICLALAQR